MTGKQFKKVIGIIPARFGSSRFPGKPLVKILDKSLIQHTYENARQSTKLHHLVVATDDQRIFDHVHSFGGKAVMTSLHCPTGSDRLVDALKQNSTIDGDMIINIQGDEPCIEVAVIDQVIAALIDSPDAVMSTAVMKLENKEDATNPSIVKCVLDRNQYALYFSRALIPAGKTLSYREECTYYKHLGIYGYRKEFLLKYAELEPTPLQLAEDLEQLKVLEHGYRIKAAIVNSRSIGVDTPEDTQKVEDLLCKLNSYS